MFPTNPKWKLVGNVRVKNELTNGQMVKITSTLQLVMLQIQSRMAGSTSQVSRTKHDPACGWDLIVLPQYLFYNCC